MAEAISTTQVSRRGEGSTQRTTLKAEESASRTQTPGKTTRTRRPVTTTSQKPSYESVSQTEPVVSEQVQTEDIGITVTFKIRITSFLGLKGGC